MKSLWLLCFGTLFLLHATTYELEVLGSGGPEIDGRASASYIIWIDGKAKILVDAGSGAMLRFEQSGGKIEDLEAILLTHLHIDHAVDLPAFIKAGYFSSRSRPLPIIGPKGNAAFPSTTEYLQNLFGTQGAYRYMHDVLTPRSDSFELRPININATQTITRIPFDEFQLETIAVHHGIVPALAFKISIGEHRVIISGDTSNRHQTLQHFTTGATLLVAHHAVSERANPFARNLHMTPSTIGQVAADIGVPTLLLSHRMRRTMGKEDATLKAIRQSFKGKVIFAEDRMTLPF